MRPRRPPDPTGESPVGLALPLLAALLAVLPSWLQLWGESQLTVESLDLPAPTIDINKAAWYEWALLEGIGEARARRIVAHRAARGGFSSLDDLRSVPGLPRRWVDRASIHLGLGEEPGAEPGVAAAGSHTGDSAPEGHNEPAR